MRFTLLFQAVCIFQAIKRKLMTYCTQFSSDTERRLCTPALYGYETIKRHNKMKRKKHVSLGGFNKKTLNLLLSNDKNDLNIFHERIIYNLFVATIEYGK